MHPRNPYDFVPFENNQRSHETPPTQEREQPTLKSGVLHCMLTVLTPLFIWSGKSETEEKQKVAHFVPHWRDGAPTIPASSLKGMVRSVMEMASNSCMGSLSERHSGVNLAGSTQIPVGYSPCATLEQLCPTCALLGMVETAKPKNREQTALAGRVWFSAATMATHQPARPQSIGLPARSTRDGAIVPLGNPKPAHRLFYFSDGRSNGRKFYYRTTQWQATLDYYKTLYQQALRGNYATITLDAIRVGSSLPFQVQFLNLRPHELELLLYSLVLEPDLCHHLGYGKPYGLGSVQLAVNGIELDAGLEGRATGIARYLTYAPPATATIVQQLSAFADLPTKVWNRGDAAATARAMFKHIAHWPQQERFAYPTREWFDNPQDGKRKTLAEYQREATATVTIAAAPQSPKATPAPVKPALPYEVGKGRWRGAVKSFNGDKGYGFIHGPNQRDVFIHDSKMRAGESQRLIPGQVVEFTIEQGPRGLNAVDVVIVQGAQ